MLRRQLAAAASAFVAALAVGIAPAVADGDGAGWGPGGIWASADEESQDADTDGGGLTDDSSDDSTSTDSWIPSGGGSGDSCASGPTSLTLELAGLMGGCSTAPALDTGDPGVVAPTVDAEAEAESAFDRMPLATADIHIAPGPPLPTYPNLETWVWVPRDQWQTLTLTVTAGATTVHVEARPVRLEVDSGERDQMKYSSTSIDPTFVCSGPGRAWHESYGDDAETSCGYTYMTTSSHNPAGGDEYHLSGSIVYEGSWTCVGQCTSEGGSLGEVSGPTGNQDVEVQERQSVVVNG
jgi:hypothetical protein